MADPVMAIGDWKNNAELIADLPKLGYLRPEWETLDLTYGLGRFWRKWQPDMLIGCDINPKRSPVGFPVDFRHTPFLDQSFDVVVFDGPYKLNGKPSKGGPADSDEDYGVEKYTRWQDRMELLCQGLEEACRLARRFVLCKMQDQVVSGAKRWQTRILPGVASGCSFVLEDQFHLRTGMRAQPKDREQHHAGANYSTLHVYRRVRRVPIAISGFIRPIKEST